MQAKFHDQKESGKEPKRFWIKIYQVAFVLTVVLIVQIYEHDIRWNSWLWRFLEIIGPPARGLCILLKLDAMRGMKGLASEFVLVFLYLWGVLGFLLWLAKIVLRDFVRLIKFIRPHLPGSDRPLFNSSNERSRTKP